MKQIQLQEEKVENSDLPITISNLNNVATIQSLGAMVASELINTGFITVIATEKGDLLVAHPSSVLVNPKSLLGENPAPEELERTLKELGYDMEDIVEYLEEIKNDSK